MNATTAAAVLTDNVLLAVYRSNQGVPAVRDSEGKLRDLTAEEAAFIPRRPRGGSPPRSDLVALSL